MTNADLHKIHRDLFQLFLNTVEDLDKRPDDLADEFHVFCATLPTATVSDDLFKLTHYAHSQSMRDMSLRRRAELAGVDLTDPRRTRWPYVHDRRSYAVRWACRKTGSNNVAEWRPSLLGGLLVPFCADQQMEISVSLICSQRAHHHLGQRCKHCGQEG